MDRSVQLQLLLRVAWLRAFRKCLGAAQALKRRLHSRAPPAAVPVLPNKYSDQTPGQQQLWRPRATCLLPHLRSCCKKLVGRWESWRGLHSTAAAGHVTRATAAALALQLPERCKHMPCQDPVCLLCSSRAQRPPPFSSVFFFKKKKSSVQFEGRIR
jgi:hypothetical protein